MEDLKAPESLEGVSLDDRLNEAATTAPQKSVPTQSHY